MEHQVVLSDVDNDNVGADIDNDANDYDDYNEDNENADKKDYDTYLQTQADLLWIPSTSDYNLHKAWLKVNF